jgi:hypothetical protein
MAIWWCFFKRAYNSDVPHLAAPMTRKYGRHINAPSEEWKHGFLYTGE